MEYTSSSPSRHSRIPLANTKNVREYLKSLRNSRPFLIFIGCVALAIIWLVGSILISSRHYIETPLPANHFHHFAQEMRDDIDVNIILIDGLGTPLFLELYDAGKLPNLRAFAETGAYVRNGVGAFPSMTGYAFYSFLTGFAAPVSEIGGLRWLQRTSQARPALRNYVGSGNVLMNSDIPTAVPLLFERFGPTAVSSSINTYMNRGTTYSEKLGWALTTAKYGPHVWYIRLLKGLRYILGDRIYRNFFEFETASFERALDHLRTYQPRVQWITAAALDSYVHVDGLEDTQFLENLMIHLDSLIGSYVRSAQKIGSKKRVFAIVSDHGMAQVEHNIDISAFLQKILPTYNIFSESMVLVPFYPQSLDAHSEKDIIVAVNGNTLCHLYLPNLKFSGSNAWLTKPELDQLSKFPSGSHHVDLFLELASLTGVEFVMTKIGDATVRVWNNKFDSCTIRCINPAKAKHLRRYQIDDETGKNFLEIPHALLSKPILRRDWLSQTLSTTYPFAVPRIFEMFESPSTGDIVITAIPGFDFGKDYELFVGNYKGGHGGLHRSQVLSPFILFGEGIRPGGFLETALSEDIGATLIYTATQPAHRLATAESLDGTVLHHFTLEK